MTPINKVSNTIAINIIYLKISIEEGYNSGSEMCTTRWKYS